MTAVIKLVNVHKTYHTGEVEVQAVRGVSMEIFPGEFVAIMGASGWQVHHDEHHWLSRPSDGRRLFSRWR